MTIRKRVLPPGWYPGSEPETRDKIQRFLRDIEEDKKENPLFQAPAGVAPHAGWEFSGRLALEVLLNLDREAETVVVIGGHMAASEGVAAAFEDGYETPLGEIKADLELLEGIRKGIGCREDRYADNTVEVQLPLVKYVFPEAAALALRVSPSREAVQLGEIIETTAEDLDRKVVVLGSTDLTHYGPSYGFTSRGRGEEAVRWVKEVNDREFIGFLLEMNPDEAVSHARNNHSACSAGAAVSALSFARKRGCTQGELLSYFTSYDIFPNQSFVGYAGIVFPDGD